MSTLTRSMMFKYQLILLSLLLMSHTTKAHFRRDRVQTGHKTSTGTSDIPQEEDVYVIEEDCPRTCTCTYNAGRLSVFACTMDPLPELPQLFYKFPNSSELVACDDHLSKIPKEISILSKLVRIKMNGNTIEYIPDEVFGLSKMFSLELNHNRISKVPKGIGNLTRLQKMVLSHNRIRWLPEVLSQSDVTILDLSSNNIEVIPDVVFKMTHLRRLLLGSNNIKDVPKEISQLSYLYKLRLDDNKIETLPESLSNLTRLVDLTLSKNKIQNNIPEVIYKLSALQWLDLSENNITALQARICNVTAVHSLRLSHNQIPTIPAEIHKLIWLMKLDVSFNKIQEVPIEISQLSNLTELHLKHNAIQTLPQELSKSSQLQILDVNHNKMVSVPSEIFQLSQLKTLDLGHNNIQAIPKGISSLVNLKILDLSYNELQVVPSDMFNLTDLLELRLSNNRISKLSGKIPDLFPLQKLNLSHNHLLKMPHQICKMSHLEQLSLRNNSIQTVPCQLSRLLTLMDLGDNAVQNVPCEQLKKSPFLVHLYLDNNHIKGVHCNLTQLKYLAILHLYNNKITTMPCLLSGSQSLSDIRLRHNSITKVPDHCFQSLPTLLYLDISYNKIEMLPRTAFDWISTSIKQIYITHNNIHTVEPGIFYRCFNSLYKVDLSYNKISTLDSWPLALSTHRGGFTADLSNNRLTNFTHIDGPFRSGKNHTRFKLQNNSISYFMDIFRGWNIRADSSKAFDYLLNHTDFYLAGNPLMCDCTDYDIYRYMHHSGKTSYRKLTCDKPPSLRGQNPADIPLTQFVCHVTVNCPDGCKCADRPHNKTMEVICENYNHTDLPTKLPIITRKSSSYHLNLNSRHVNRISFRPYLSKVTDVILSNNSITEVDMKVLISLSEMKVLHLDNNDLQRLPDSIDYINNGSVHDIKLSNNPWVCDCKASKLVAWIQTNADMISDSDSIVCHSPHDMKGIKVIHVDRLSLCVNQNMAAVYIVASIAAVVFLAFLGAGLQDHIRYAHWRLFGRDECDGEGKEFDVFVSYASEDESYILDYLIPELERRGYKVCFHLVHFHGGKPIHVNIYECIEKSKRMLVFFSNHFYESNFSLFEFHMALDLDIRNGTRRLITIKDTDLNMDGFEITVTSYFKTHSYIRKDDENFWKNLEYTLPRMRLGTEGALL